jgi:sugar lactone lactonase YvrE
MGKFTLIAGLMFTALTVGAYWRGSAIVVVDDYHLELLTPRSPIGAADGLCWHQGWLYVAAEGSAAIFRMDGQGTVETLATRDDGISSPEDLVVDQAGVIYFSDDDVGGVFKLAPGKKPLPYAQTVKPMSATEGIALLPSGSVLIGDNSNHEVVLLDAEGRQLECWQLPRIHKPESIAVGEDGHVYIADDHAGCIVRRDASGKAEVILSQRDGLQEPETIHFAAGTLYIVDNAAHRLLRYREGQGLEPMVQFGGRLRNIQGITSDDAGNLYLSVQSNLERNEGYLLKLVKRSSPR